MARTRNILIISILLFLLGTTFRRPGVTLFWRRAQNSSSGRLMHSYQAPAQGCEWPDVIRGNYLIYLHHGCSIEKHLQTVDERLQTASPQTDLKSKITHVWPETKHHGLYYSADNLDIWTIRAVRYDIVVDMVECSRSPEVNLGGFDEIH